MIKSQQQWLPRANEKQLISLFCTRRHSVAKTATGAKQSGSDRSIICLQEQIDILELRFK